MLLLQTRNRLPVLPSILLGALLLTRAIGAGAPNILFIVGDDMGYADVGFHGCKDIPTPHLDALARNGVRFTNGYVSGPYCSPTRAGLLTGRYQTRFGHEFNPGGSQDSFGLPLTQSTIANRLKEAGYTTGLVGKWHLGSAPAMRPVQRGFDEFFGFLGGSHSYFENNGILRGDKQVSDLDYTTDAFGREACSFVERNRGKPWFLYLAFNAVHTPMHATDARLAKFPHESDQRRKTYNAMMLAMDEAIGQVVDTLKKTDQYSNTLVTFISDNGGPTMVGTTVNGSKNTPFRGGKRTTLEGGIRVPFLMSWPEKIKPSVYEQPVIQLDLHATALAAAGIQPKAEWKIDGVDLIPYLSGIQSSGPHNALYWRFGDQMAIRRGAWKLVRYDVNADSNSRVRQEATPPKLYNLVSDIHEDHDLSEKHPDVVRDLQKDWDRWNELNVPSLWGKGRNRED